MVPVDDDQDGYNGIEDGGDDCDDDDPTIFPTAVRFGTMEWIKIVWATMIMIKTAMAQSDQHGGMIVMTPCTAFTLVLLIIGTTVLIKIATVCLITIKW